MEGFYEGYFLEEGSLFKYTPKTPKAKDTNSKNYGTCHLVS